MVGCHLQFASQQKLSIKLHMPTVISVHTQISAPKKRSTCTGPGPGTCFSKHQHHQSFRVTYSAFDTFDVHCWYSSPALYTASRMSELKTTQRRGKMGPCKGQIAQDVLGFRRRWQELEAERAGSAGGGSEPRAAMKKVRAGDTGPRTRARRRHYQARRLGVHVWRRELPRQWHVQEVWTWPIASAVHSWSRRVKTSAAHARRPAGASNVKAEIDYDCHRGQSAFQRKAESARGHGTNNEGAPGYGARSIADSNDWTDPGETSGSSAATTRPGLGIGERGASQRGGSQKSKTQSKQRRRRSRRPEAADSDRGCQRGRAQIAAGKGTQRTRGGGRNAASARRPCGARGHQRTGREKASRRPAKL